MKKDKLERAERELPPPCVECRSPHKEYKTSLCLLRQVRYCKLEVLRAIPLISQIVPEWTCDLKEERES